MRVGVVLAHDELCRLGMTAEVTRAIGMRNLFIDVEPYPALNARWRALLTNVNEHVCRGWQLRLHAAFQAIDSEKASEAVLVLTHQLYAELIDVLEGELVNMGNSSRRVLRIDAYVTRFCEQLRELQRSEPPLQSYLAELSRASKRN